MTALRCGRESGGGSRRPKGEQPRLRFDDVVDGEVK